MKAIEIHRATKEFDPTMEGWDILKLRFKHIAMELSSKIDMGKTDKRDQLKQELTDIEANLKENVQIT